MQLQLHLKKTHQRQLMLRNMCLNVVDGCICRFAHGIESMLRFVQEHWPDASCMLLQNGTSFHFATEANLTTLHCNKWIICQNLKFLELSYLVSELIRHNSPVTNHVSSGPGSLVSPINSCLNDVLKPMVKMVQNISNGVDFVPEHSQRMN